MSLSPDGKIIAVVGDDPAGLLVDANTGKVSTVQYRMINGFSVYVNLWLFVSDR
jgi:hypothetical protein